MALRLSRKMAIIKGIESSLLVKGIYVVINAVAQRPVDAEGQCYRDKRKPTINPRNPGRKKGS